MVSRRLSGLERLLWALVVRESPSYEKAHVDALGAFVAARMRKSGGRVRRFRSKGAGDSWLGEWGRGRGGVLVLGHLDTVYPLGTLAKMPWKKTNGRIFGPGIFDMKAGIAIALAAMETLHKEEKLTQRRISLFFNGDEEVGSFSSRRHIERLARSHDMTLCLEPALPNGAVKTARRGVGRFTVSVKGRASHSGAAARHGISAILEMTAQIKRLMALENPRQGTSVNVGVIEGGVLPNIVPAACRIEVDVRVANTKEQIRVARALRTLRPSLSGASIHVSGKWHRPVMYRTREIARAFLQARRIAHAAGMPLKEGSIGGSSDANFIAAMHLPVLCGLGPVGAGAHAAHEHVSAALLPQRCALLAALLAQWPNRKK